MRYQILVAFLAVAAAGVLSGCTSTNTPKYELTIISAKEYLLRDLVL